MYRSKPLYVVGLERIRNSDITYIHNFEGYVGKSVALDIGHAMGIGKVVYALESISDPEVTHLINKILEIRSR